MMNQLLSLDVFPCVFMWKYVIANQIYSFNCLWKSYAVKIYGSSNSIYSVSLSIILLFSWVIICFYRMFISKLGGSILTLISSDCDRNLCLRSTKWHVLHVHLIYYLANIFWCVFIETSACYITYVYLFQSKNVLFILRVLFHSHCQSSFIYYCFV